jgi:hypothetical protein
MAVQQIAIYLIIVIHSRACLTSQYHPWQAELSTCCENQLELKAKQNSSNITDYIKGNMFFYPRRH